MTAFVSAHSYNRHSNCCSSAAAACSAIDNLILDAAILAESIFIILSILIGQLIMGSGGL